uniref:hypothetical protein ycf41 n=1 Tax=Nemalion vermiculare TaxID=935621 RepID=UPI00257B7F15|nr:hypothetical protein ycf41 [Nemalion vermiculare]WGV34450.1 hypothetical protein ycf41 [Nemalion vermiculare]
MQHCVLTVQIITWPKKTVVSSKEIKSHFFVKLPNAKQGEEYYYLNAISKGRVAENIYNSYEKGDYLLIEGYILNSVTSITSSLSLLVSKEHPVFLPS